MRATGEHLQNRTSSARLDPDFNRLLVKESTGKLAIQPSIVKLLPTVHALVFAVNTTVECREKVAVELGVMKKELE